MKLFFGLLAFFMLGMSLLPCSDSTECGDEAQTISTSTSHQQHEHQDEECTPFCSCACCGVSAFYTPVLRSQMSKAVFQTEKHFANTVAIRSHHAYTIWQPPRLS